VKGAWHREAVGGRWEEVGRLQFDFVTHFISRETRVLDVACGSLRLGRLLVPWLDAWRYVGLDANPDLLSAGLKELGRTDRHPALLVGVCPCRLPDADVVWIHALFDHIPPSDVEATLREALAAAPLVLATFFVGDDTPVLRGGAVVTYPNREYWHHSESWIATQPGFVRLHEYSHPLELTVAEFRA
jgi:SAM-dependent methyltransferase